MSTTPKPQEPPKPAPPPRDEDYPQFIVPPSFTSPLLNQPGTPPCK